MGEHYDHAMQTRAATELGHRGRGDMRDEAPDSLLDGWWQLLADSLSADWIIRQISNILSMDSQQTVMKLALESGGSA